MSLKSWLIRPYAHFVARKVKHWMQNPFEAQDKIFKSITHVAAATAFGKEHHFNKIRNYSDFKNAVPLRDYEQLKPYIEKIIAGEKHVLWPGQPLYLAKTSGTTSGVKYIPVTRDSVKNHFYTAQTALLLFMLKTKKWQLMDGRMIFLSGSPELEMAGNIPTGRLSGIVNHQIPKYLKGNQLPSWETNCIEDWEQKLEKIVQETMDQNMTIISGIPPWMQMYFDKLVEKKQRPVKDIFPHLQTLVHGGVNFEPYRARLTESIGKEIPMIETYPASEGFIAFQDEPQHQGLLLNVDSGIFFEFVKTSEIFNENPQRYSVKEVEPGINYAIIINSNAGLYGYVLGDTVKFLSLQPLRISVTGRIHHYISAFGEHVIMEEVEAALKETLATEHALVTEFTVAPYLSNGNLLPHHQWLIEFEKPPTDIQKFSEKLDNILREKNIYYNDLRTGNVLQSLQVKPLQKNAFINYMKQQGKLGGQNKVPRLANDRKLADEILGGES